MEEGKKGDMGSSAAHRVPARLLMAFQRYCTALMHQFHPRTSKPPQVAPLAALTCCNLSGRSSIRHTQSVRTPSFRPANVTRSGYVPQQRPAVRLCEAAESATNCDAETSPASAPSSRRHTLQRSRTLFTSRALLGGVGVLLGRALLRRIYTTFADPKPAKECISNKQTAIVWFRSDLRLHDHHALLTAIESDTLSLLPVYCFDPREYSQAAPGFDKTGAPRARFILDSVEDLRRGLRALGSDLLVRIGRPEDVLPALAKQTKASAVYCHMEVTSEDSQVEAWVQQALRSLGAELRPCWGGTLHHLEDLPFQLGTMPGCYSDFQKQVQDLQVRSALPAPQALKPLPMCTALQFGQLPSMQRLGFSPAAQLEASYRQQQRRAVLLSCQQGGESQGFKHLQAFVSDLRARLGHHPDMGAGKQLLPSPWDEPNDCFSFTSHISPWLAMGCLSPRKLYHEIMTCFGTAQTDAPGTSQTGTHEVDECREQDRDGDECREQDRDGDVVCPGGAGRKQAGRSQAELQQCWIQELGEEQVKGTQGRLMFELLWRDFFRLVTRKYSTHIPVEDKRKSKQRKTAPMLVPY